MKTRLRPRRPVPHLCPKCGEAHIAVAHYSDTLEFKGLTVDVDGLATTKCNSCGFRWETEGQEHDNLARLKSAFATKRDHVREVEGLLTGDQIEFVLSELNLSKAEAAALFGGGPNAFSKYISGDVLQSYPMDRLLRVTLAFGEPAVRYLKSGRHAPLSRNAGGFFVASPIGTSTRVTVIANEAREVKKHLLLPTESQTITIGN